MKILLKQIKIVDPLSEYHNKEMDVLIEDGFIIKIENSISQPVDEEFVLKDKILVPSFVDMGASVPDPGFEHRETIPSALRSAYDGGISMICVFPNNEPVVDSKGQVEYILSRSLECLGDALPYGAISVGCKGEAMAEMHDLHAAGAVAFSDGNLPVANAELLLKALQYTTKFDALVVNRCLDESLSSFGQIHEGAVSTNLGLPGIPSLSEYTVIQRDIEILKYTQSRLHISGLSTKEGVELVRRAKKSGLKISSDVTISNLIYTDDSILGFDTNYKVSPPLRSEEDRQALIEGVNDGTIDVIISNHLPQDKESKNLEFDLAENGMLSLQTFYSLLLKTVSAIDFDTIVRAVAHNPRKLLGLHECRIEVGARGSISILDPNLVWSYDDSSNKSISQNSPLFDQQVTGKCVGMIHNGAFEFDKND